MTDYFGSTRASRAPSVSSAGTASTTGAYSFLPRYMPKPDPAYISASAAAEHVTHRHLDEMHDLRSPTASPTNDGALFSDSALALLNSFLDSLLYNFLAKSRGTKLSQLRPAIVEVLKAKLGREALASADEELEGLVGDGDDEDMEEDNAQPNGVRDGRRTSVTSLPDWHLESSFKRMRLRVMVFIRLGDFDDDDEDKFLEDEDESGASSHDLNMLSSSAPVYLASVLEYLAEQSLSIAGDAAYTRGRSRARRTISENSPVEHFDQEGIIVEDIDVEKIALNSALGRLWRTWRKNYRAITSPATPIMNYSRRSSVASPTRSADDMLRRQGIRKNSTSSMIKEERETPQAVIPDCNPTETDIAANIPLPTNEQDVDEIEVPGLASVIYDEGEDRFDDEIIEKPQLKRLRSSSFVVPGRFMPDMEVNSIPETTSRPVFQRQRSNSVPALNTMPWNWIPAYVRRALHKYANMSEEERLEYASSIPLPDDRYVDGEEIALDAASIPLPDDMDEHDQKVATVATDEDVSAGPTEEELEMEKTALKDELPARSSAGSKSKTGEMAEAAALASAAAGATAAAVSRSFPGKEKPEVTERPSSRDSLSVQTKEVFEPDEPDTARQSIEVAPQASRESSADTVVQVQPAKQRVATSLESNAPEKGTVEQPGVHVLKKQASFADKDRPLMSVYSPRNTATNDETHNEVTQQALRSLPPAVPSKNRAAGQATGAEANGVNELTAPGVVPLDLDNTTSGVDSKLTSPNHIASQAVGTPEARKTPPKQSPSSSPTPEKFPDFANGENESAVAPEEEEQRTSAKPAVSQPSKPTPAPEGPPKPLGSMGGQSPHPYAMLYDDIEPDAIGVAKTSNVPIHSTTPSLSTESRPWTPNRGANTTVLPSQTAATVEQRNRNIPCPLRVGTPDQELQASQQQRDAPKAAVSKTDDYDLDKPINPERFSNWNRAKESPTIPKFYNQPASTPTTAEASRPVNGSPAHHSPKGSQGSQKSQSKRVSEEIKEREFDALLDRKETVKYTLTPEEIRDVGPYFQKTTGLDRNAPTPIDTTRKPALPAALSPTLFRRTTSQQGPQVPQVPPSPKRPLKISDIRKSISALSPEPAEPKMRRSGLMARNARVAGGETKDFVDFIRSCAPTSDDQTQPPVLSHRLSANSSLQGAQASQSKKTMVPREPDLRNGTSGDLIDFIRRGPPGPPASSSADREPRIPRTVAPFRSTMDSDDLGNLVNGSSPHNSVLSRPSVTDSYTSTAPLMNTNRGLPANSKGPSLTAPPPQMARKTRRNKDPYAIDSDDEDEEPRTETLAEFLMATNPTSSRQNEVSNGGPSSSRQEPLNSRTPVSAASRSHQNTSGLQNQKGATLPPQESSMPNLLTAEPSHPAPGASSLARKKLEARPAGATRGFGGLGYYYSTHDLASYLRSSGPNGAGLNGNAMNGGPVSAVGSNSNRMSDSMAGIGGRRTPSTEDVVKKSNSMRKRLWGRA